MSYTPPVGSATTTKQGILRLSGALAGTADAPALAANAVTSASIAGGAVTEAKLDNAVQVKLNATSNTTSNVVNVRTLGATGNKTVDNATLPLPAP